METRNLLIFVAIAVAAFGFGYGYMAWNDGSGVGVSTEGTQFGNAKLAAISWIPVSGTATSTSVFNYDRQDRVIESTFANCEGVSTDNADLNIRAATTSAPGILTNTNLAMNVTLASTTAGHYTATTTYNTYNHRVWPAGSYLTFWLNATSTGNCIVGAKYIQR